MTGRVLLVGAGPGDPGLLTLRAHRVLARADVIVCDDLVPARLLADARADAEVVRVGPAHGDAIRMSQAEIDALLIERARRGHLVVRLKNGDPFLFGRGGEEADALKRAGVPFEVVPGVTSAIAAPAYAGIPLTHRDHTSLVTIVTGHAACAKDPPALPWKELARSGGTLVVLMGMRTLDAIITALLEHGLAPATPAAAIHRGTTARQVTVAGTLATLAPMVRSAGIGAPSVVVLGSVVGLRDGLAWCEQRPLFGRRILVTRPRAQAGPLADRLEDAGAEVVLFPTIELKPPDHPEAFDRAVQDVASFDWVVFTSANGVRAFLGRMEALGRDVRELARLRIAAIGPETARELGRYLLRPELVPTRFVAEGLLEALDDRAIVGQRFLLPRAAGARALLAEVLRARGAVVDEVQAYRMVRPAGTEAATIRKALLDTGIDAVTLTSSSTVRNLVELIGADALRHAVLACIGPVTAATARGLGLEVLVEAEQFTTAALADALIRHFSVATLPSRGGSTIPDGE